MRLLYLTLTLLILLISLDSSHGSNGIFKECKGLEKKAKKKCVKQIKNNIQGDDYKKFKKCVLNYFLHLLYTLII